MTYNADDLADLLASAIPAANMDLDTLQISRTPHGTMVMILVDADQYLTVGIHGPYTSAELGQMRRELGDPEMAAVDREAKGCTHPEDEPCFGRPKV